MSRLSNCQELWVSFLESRGDDIDAVLEDDPSDNVSEKLVPVQFPPLALGGLSEHLTVDTIVLGEGAPSDYVNGDPHGASSPGRLRGHHLDPTVGR